jgi:hypothetical protein
MKQIQLGKTGPAVSAFGLGCMGMSGMYGPADRKESLATLQAAVDAGITLLDTGDFYGMGHNELLIGEALKTIPRDRLPASVRRCRRYSQYGRAGLPRLPRRTSSRRMSCRFRADLGDEFLLVDDKSLVPPLRDQVLPIVGLHREYELSAVDRQEFDGYRDLETGRRCRLVAYIDVRADGLLSRPVQMGIDRPDTGPFEQPNHETRRKDFRHHHELI